MESRQNNRKRGQPVQLVLWEGYPDEDATWEPWEHIQGTAEEALEEFHNKYPDAPLELDTYESKWVQSKRIQSKRIQSKRIQSKRVDSKRVEGRQDRSTQDRSTQVRRSTRVRRQRVQTKE